jgi:putative Holliday junction resolvase
MSKILAIDPGSNYVGLAFADTNSVKIAVPLKVLKNGPQAYVEIAEICSKNKIDLILIGLPRNLDGNETSQTTFSKDFASELSRFVPSSVEIDFQDETLSSVEAEFYLDYGKKTNVGKKRIDDKAAAIILQDYIELRMCDGMA